MNQPVHAAHTHERRSAQRGEVLQQPLGVVDGRVELRTRREPAAVQVLPRQRTPVATDENDCHARNCTLDASHAASLSKWVDATSL